jgi:hypothetical protein
MLSVFLAKEDRGSLLEVKWMAVGKLLMRKSFSEESLRWTMMAAWNIGREVTFRSTERNLFTIQAHYLGDWKRIMEEGPWLFRDCALMVEKFDCATTTPSVILKKVQTWIQIHKVPHCTELKQFLGNWPQGWGRWLRWRCRWSCLGVENSTEFESIWIRRNH